MTLWAPLLSPETVIDYVAMLLLLQHTIGTFTTRYACFPRCWLGGVIYFVAINTIVVLAVWLACFNFSRAVLFHSFFFQNMFYFFVSLFLFSCFLISLSNSLVCWLAFCPRVQCGWHCIVKSPCCICNVYRCLAVCDHREFVSLGKIGTDNDCARCIDRWKHQFKVKNTQREEHTHLPYVSFIRGSWVSCCGIFLETKISMHSTIRRPLVF